MTRRVLLIEDEPALARGLSDTLRKNGFDVTVAADGSLAPNATGVYGARNVVVPTSAIGRSSAWASNATPTTLPLLP